MAAPLSFCLTVGHVSHYNGIALVCGGLNLTEEWMQARRKLQAVVESRAATQSRWQLHFHFVSPWDTYRITMESRWCAAGFTWLKSGCRRIANYRRSLKVGRPHNLDGSSTFILSHRGTRIALQWNRVGARRALPDWRVDAGASQITGGRWKWGDHNNIDGSSTFILSHRGTRIALQWNRVGARRA